MNSYTVDIQVETDVASETAALLLATATATLRAADVAPPVALVLLLTDDATVRRLNRRYRAEDKTTDVLSFPADEEPARGGEPVYLGDIAISAPQAARQAARGGHPVSAELQLLTIHGILHLLGYDHAESADKARIWALQTAILQQLDIPLIAPADTDSDN